MYGGCKDCLVFRASFLAEESLLIWLRKKRLRRHMITWTNFSASLLAIMPILRGRCTKVISR